VPTFSHCVSVILLLVTLVAGKALASDFSDSIVNQYQLKSLANSDNLATVTGDKVTIAMLYQPDCKWCKKQGQWLAKAQNQCNKDINIVLIGNNGNKQQLKRELKHFHQKIPAFQANRKLLTAIGGIKASPTTLVFDQKGNLIAKRRGFITNSKLTDVANLITQGKCNIA